MHDTDYRHAIAGLVLVATLVVGPLASAAQNAEQVKGSATTGRLLYYSPATSRNGLSCAHCHADFDEERRPDGMIRSAHSLYNAARRETFWGQEIDSPDRYVDISSAAVVCVETFMLNPDKLTASQKLSLEAYLRVITRRPTLSPLTYTAGADLTGGYVGFEGGDKRRGRRLFFAACHVCHPNGGTGIAPLPIPRGADPAEYARKIREGNGLGAVFSGLDPTAYVEDSGLFMPFFGVDLLANQQIRDIIAYIQSLPPSR